MTAERLVRAPHRGTNSGGYHAYYLEFMAFIKKNAEVDVESKKHSNLVLNLFLPLTLFSQGQHWGEFELMRAMRLKLLPAFNDFGAWKYTKLTARLEYRYHCRSPMVNVLNELHTGHSISGVPGKLLGGVPQPPLSPSSSCCPPDQS